MPKLKSYYLLSGIVTLGMCYVLFVLRDDAEDCGRQCHQPQLYSQNEWYPSNVFIADHHLHYMSNNDVCETNSPSRADINVLILVSSHPQNRRLRDAMRHGLNTKQLAEIGGRRLFLLAKPATPKVQALLNTEILMHRDILQGDFMDAYRNLTYKHLMGLHWVTKYCPQTHYVLKMDDDIAVDLFHLMKHLMSTQDFFQQKQFMAGFAFSGSELTVQRNPSSKWHLKLEEYHQDRFPPFLSGWMYLTNVATAEAITQAASQKDCLWIDDVYITGLLRDKLNVPVLSYKEWFTVHEENLKCCIKDPWHTCKFLVGPVNKDPDLLREFLQHSYTCFKANCSQSVPDNRICATPFVHDRLMRDRGKAEVRLLS